jgi:fructose-1-phosphate kinase PfkB-like protein
LVTLLDSSGAGLREGIAGQPDILKVNSRELAELAAAENNTETYAEGAALPDLHHLPGLTAYLRDRLGVWATEVLIVTLGRDGALAVTTEGAYHAPAPAVPVVSPAGAGDAVSAGMMLARRRGETWPEALRLGMAAAAAVVQNEGTAVCTAAQVNSMLPLVKVREVAL